MDRLSQLPECLILSILSFLPIDEAARTSVLSKQWKNLWTKVTSIDLSDHKMTPHRRYTANGLTFSNDISEKFNRFVTDLLVPRPDSFTIEKLKFESIQGCQMYSSYMNRWLQYALSRGLTELHINCTPFLFPSYVSSVFTVAAKNLRTLRLTNLHDVDSQTATKLPSLHLPHLTFLELGITNPDRLILDQLFCQDNFPALSTLHLDLQAGHDKVDFVYATDLRIISRTLKDLKIGIIGRRQKNMNNIVVRLDTPALRDFHLVDYTLLYLVAGVMPNLEMGFPQKCFDEDLNTTVLLSNFHRMFLRDVSYKLGKLPCLYEISEPVENLCVRKMAVGSTRHWVSIDVVFKSQCLLEDKYFRPNKVGERPWYHWEDTKPEDAPWYSTDGIKFAFKQT